MNERRGGNLEEPLVGRQIQFQRVREYDIYFRQFIDRDFLARPIPENIRKSRNLAIILTGIQFFCAIAALGLYFKRRVSFKSISSLWSLEQNNPWHHCILISLVYHWPPWDFASQHKITLHPCFLLFVYSRSFLRVPPPRYVSFQ